MINFYCYHNDVLDKPEYELALKSLTNDYDMIELPIIEHIIRRDPYYAYRYSSNVLKCRWLEAEPHIMKSPSRSYWYARSVIKGRWLEAEECIKKDDFWWELYCVMHNIDESLMVPLE